MNIISKMNKPPASGSLSQVVLCTLVFDIYAPVFWSKVHVSAICSPFTPICSFQGEDLGSGDDLGIQKKTSAKSKNQSRLGSSLEISVYDTIKSP